MVGKKIKALLSLKDKKQGDLLDVLDMASKQTLSNKFSLNRFTVKDLIIICEFLGCEIDIKDKGTGKTLIVLDKEDL